MALFPLQAIAPLQQIFWISKAARTFSLELDALQKKYSQRIPRVIVLCRHICRCMHPSSKLRGELNERTPAFQENRWKQAQILYCTCRLLLKSGSCAPGLRCCDLRSVWSGGVQGGEGRFKLRALFAHGCFGGCRMDWSRLLLVLAWGMSPSRWGSLCTVQSSAGSSEGTETVHGSVGSGCCCAMWLWVPLAALRLLWASCACGVCPIFILAWHWAKVRREASE